MAIITKLLGHVRDGTGAIATLDMDYDDLTLRISRVRCINDTTSVAFVEFKRLSDGLVYSAVCAAGQTTAVVIPTAIPATRLQLFVSTGGKLGGVDKRFYLM